MKALRLLTFFLVCLLAQSLAFTASANCGYQTEDLGNLKRKVVTTPAKEGRVELLTIPRASKGPWVGDDYQITVQIFNGETCQPARSTVWYKDNVGSNHDLKTNKKGVPYHRSVWTDRIGRPQFGVFRLRAWRSKSTPLVFVVTYGPAGPVESGGGLPGGTGAIVTIDPEPDISAPPITITLRNQASFDVVYEITDSLCKSSQTIAFKPWEEIEIRLCTDGNYGKFSYRDVRNAAGVSVSLVRNGDRINM